jgi:type I restriction enzyme, S subunit
MTNNGKIEQLQFASHGAPFTIPHGWNWDLLSKALKHRKEVITIDDNTEYRRVTVQLHGRGIVPRDSVKGAEIKTKQQKVIRANDFLVAEIDAKVGGFGIVPTSLAGAIVSSHYFTFEIDSELLLPGFLHAFIKVGFITKSIETSVRGSLNYAAIRPAHVLRMQFPFAPITDQEHVMNRMAKIEEAIEAAQRQLEALQFMPGAIIRDAIGVVP